MQPLPRVLLDLSTSLALQELLFIGKLDTPLEGATLLSFRQRLHSAVDLDQGFRGLTIELLYHPPSVLLNHELGLAGHF